jgi:hypothetical protein
MFVAGWVLPARSSAPRASAEPGIRGFFAPLGVGRLSYDARRRRVRLKVLRRNMGFDFRRPTVEVRFRGGGGEAAHRPIRVLTNRPEQATRDIRAPDRALRFAGEEIHF